MNKKWHQKPVPLGNALIAGGLLAFLAAAFSYSWVEGYLFQLDAPSANYPEPASEAEARVQDLDYLEKYVRGFDRTYSTRARGEALDLIADYKERAAEMTFTEFELAVSRIVALAENGHSTVWGGSRSRRHPVLPVHGYWFDDGYYIVAANPGYEDYLGAKITRFGALSAQEAYERFRDTYGGPDSGYKAYALPLMLENTDFLAAIGAIDDPEAPGLTLVMPGAEEQAVVMTPDPPDPERLTVWSWALLMPGLSVGRELPWTQFNSNLDNQPLYLQNGDKSFQIHPIPEVDGLFVQFRANQDHDGEPIKPFVARVRTAIKEIKPRVLVIDERQNGGGDYTKTADLMFDIPDLLPPDARIYVITGFETFSAAISSIGFLKAAAGGRLTIVGREAGDSPMGWGETNEFILPNSGIGMTAARGFHDQVHGCYDRLKCYWKDFGFQVAVGYLDPDIPVAFTFADFAAGRDAALEKILEMEGRK